MTFFVACLTILVALTSVTSKPWSPSDDSKPEFSCPANEEYYKCSQIHCFKSCKHLTSSPACPSVSPDCYKPACECIEDYLRNDEGICVPYQKCENWSPSLPTIAKNKL